MKDKIESIIDRYNGIEKLMADQDVLSNLDKLKDLAKEYKQLVPIVMAGKEYIKILNQIIDWIKTKPNLLKKMCKIKVSKTPNNIDCSFIFD